MTFDPVSVVSWHNARPNAIQINISSIQVGSLPVPYWKAKTDARCHFRVQVGVYSEHAAMLAQSRYQTALVEYQIKLQEWQRRKDEDERERRREGMTSGLSGLASAFTRPHVPASPTEADAVEYHWSKTMSASISLDETTPACKARSVLPGASDNLFDWITVHSSPTALAGSAVTPVEVDAALIKKTEAAVIGTQQDAAIKSRIAAEQFDYVGTYEAQRIDFDHAPGILHCHVWRVQITCEGKKTTLLVGADGAIFGRHLTVTSMASKVALASFVAVASMGAVWVGVSKMQAPSASASAYVAANVPKIQQSVAMPVPRPIAASTTTPAVPQPSRFSRCAGSTELEKCEAMEIQLARETPAQAAERRNSLETARAAAQLAVAGPSFETQVIDQTGTLDQRQLSGLQDKLAAMEKNRSNQFAGKAIGEMLLSASNKDWATVFGKAQAIKAAFVQPPRGDRKMARAANTAGLALLSQNQFNEATKIFADAFTADQSDLEILNNLGYSSILAGQYSNGSEYIVMAISAAPERTSAWANLSEAFAALDKQPEALAAMQLAILFSANREKTVEYLTGIRDTHKSPHFRSVASLALDQIDAVPRGQMELPATSLSLARASKIVATN